MKKAIDAIKKRVKKLTKKKSKKSSCESIVVFVDPLGNGRLVLKPSGAYNWCKSNSGYRELGD